MAPGPFDPAAIPPFSVIKIPIVTDKGYTEPKRFVVISHVNGHAYCIKTTSQTAAFDACRESVLTYKEKECSLFEKETVIDPRNQFPISHDQLAKNHHDGEFENHGCLPQDFKAKLIEVVKKSRVIEHGKKKRLLSQLGEVTPSQGKPS